MGKSGFMVNPVGLGCMGINADGAASYGGRGSAQRMELPCMKKIIAEMGCESRAVVRPRLFHIRFSEADSFRTILRIKK